MRSLPVLALTGTLLVAGCTPGRRLGVHGPAGPG
jgi:hypothetical protein